MLRQARSLGVGDRVMRHSASLTELGKRGDWAAVRRELIATQDDVEQAMTALRDQKMAHLISLGGWLRGLEITSGAVESKYTPERAAVLWQRDLINYFAEEMKTLPPRLAHTPLFEKLRSGIGAIRTLLNHAPPDRMSLTEVKALHAKARELNLAIARRRVDASTHLEPCRSGRESRVFDAMSWTKSIPLLAGFKRRDRDRFGVSTSSSRSCWRAGSLPS